MIEIVRYNNEYNRIGIRGDLKDLEIANIQRLQRSASYLEETVDRLVHLLLLDPVAYKEAVAECDSLRLFDRGVERPKDQYFYIDGMSYEFKVDDLRKWIESDSSKEGYSKENYVEASRRLLAFFIDNTQTKLDLSGLKLLSLPLYGFIEEFAFRLEELNLSDNLLTEAPSFIFHTQYLRELDLRGNSIRLNISEEGSKDAYDDQLGNIWLVERIYLDEETEALFVKEYFPSLYEKITSEFLDDSKHLFKLIANPSYNLSEMAPTSQSEEYADLLKNPVFQKYDRNLDRYYEIDMDPAYKV